MVMAEVEESRFQIGGRRDMVGKVEIFFIRVKGLLSGGNGSEGIWVLACVQLSYRSYN